MSDTLNTPTIAIDRGASCTDFAVIDSENLLKTISIEKRDWQSIVTTYNRLADRYPEHRTIFTGSTAGMPDGLKGKTRTVSEIDAIGFGGSTLANYSDCIVASIGTGTAIVHFADHAARHVGGTGIGGGTIKGLSSIMCDLVDPLQIEEQAQKGNPSKINMTISDLGYEGLSFLGSEMTASNFADAREFKCQDRIVIVGKVANSQFIRHTIDLVGNLYETKFTFPDNPGYATVYGAAVKDLYDRSLSNKN
jgi:hypothetical protein